ncbi:14975_t:CDS:2, partial [Cetraspora pellucida]
AINEIEEVNQLACSAHTLQLVVGKGLLPVKTLVVQTSNINKNHEYLQAIADVPT